MAISFQTLVVAIVTVVFLHIWSTRYVWHQGTKYYEDTTKPAAILDIVHNNTPDWSAYNDTKNWFLLIYVIPFFMNRSNGDWISEAIIKACIMFALRSLSIVATILPKDSRCKVNQLDPYHLTVGGTCYDKMFSGHFAFGLLSTSLLFKYGFVSDSVASIGLWSIINVMNFVLLTVTRGHYTQDLLVALFVVALVHLGYEKYVSNVI
uniref:Sphingomyelin synthase-like domain-containing protein n=1 Tax=viral metagenome TaxID=1070528 RepID=A0A6C0H6M0_9ZZZZ